MAPTMTAKIMRAFEIMRTSLSDGEILGLLKQGHAAELIALRLTEQPWFNNAMTSVTTATQDMALRASRQYQTMLPKAGAASLGVAGAIGIDLSNPLVYKAMTKLKSAATVNLAQSTANTLTQTVQSGLSRGLGSKRIAKELRSVIGLSPSQAQAVANFENMLRNGDRAALTRKLRNHRFDGTLRKTLGKGGKGLTPDQITKMSEAYRKRMISFNAHQQARTLANDAMRSGQRMVWEDAIARGMANTADLYKQRVSMRDGKVRTEHVLIDGQVRRFNETYSNDEMVVGELDWGCRCMEVYFSDPTGTRFGKGRGPRGPNQTQPSNLDPAPMDPKLKAANKTARQAARDAKKAGTVPPPPPAPAAPAGRPAFDLSANRKVETALAGTEGFASPKAAKRHKAEVSQKLGARIGAMTPEQRWDIAQLTNTATRSHYGADVSTKKTFLARTAKMKPAELATAHQTQASRLVSTWATSSNGMYKLSNVL